MRAKKIHLISRFNCVLSLFVGLVVAACSSADAPATQATPTVGVPAFATKREQAALRARKEGAIQ